MVYLDMENASIEIEIDSISSLKLIIENNYDSFCKMNFQRIIFNIPNKILFRCLDIIEENSNKDKPIFIIKTKINEDFNKLLKENILIINISKNMIENENIYNEIKLTKNNIKLISNLLQKNIKVIVNPVIDCLNIKEFNDLLENLFTQNTGKNIMFNNYLIPTSLIKEHPCNFELCDGWKCGKKISMLPRMLYFDKGGYIYPYGIKKTELKIGNIKDNNIDNILKQYIESKEYTNFRKLLEECFIKYIPGYPYKLFPLDCYLKWEARKNVN